MKKILFLMVSAVVLCSSFVLATNSQESTSVNSESSIVKCEFTLNHYTGTFPRNAWTDKIVVQLNCPMDEDVTVNVHVWVGDERIASQPFTIKAGKKTSEEASIVVSDDYAGMKYRLTVN